MLNFQFEGGIERLGHYECYQEASKESHDSGAYDIGHGFQECHFIDIFICQTNGSQHADLLLALLQITFKADY